VDAEDNDRRLAPQVDAQPSVQQDEHRGLAGRILELRNTIEEQRLAGIQERAQLGQRMAQLEQQVSAMGARVDREVEAIQKTQQQLGNLLREGGEQVRVTGDLSRKMTDQVKVLEELREMASDPHEVVKPLQKSLALLRGDLEALSKTIDVRFEQMPKNRSQPLESRGEDEQPLVKMGAEIRKLKERVTELETG
jgi:chromosome segregation ATPase